MTAIVILEDLLAHLDRQIKWYKAERAALRTENTDLRARLEAAERERDELRLRDALAAVCEAAEERHSDGWRSCNICEGWRPAPEEFHASDCPIAAARALLGGEGGA